MKSIETIGADGERVNLSGVPVGEDLEPAITVLADYGEDGKADLTYRILDSEGEEQRDGRFKAKSSKKEQVFTDQFYFLWSQGEDFTVEVELKVSRDGEEKSDSDPWPFI